MNLFAFTVGKLSAFGNFLLYTVMQFITDQNVNITNNYPLLTNLYL